MSLYMGDIAIDSTSKSHIYRRRSPCVTFFLGDKIVISLSGTRNKCIVHVSLNENGK